MPEIIGSKDHLPEERTPGSSAPVETGKDTAGFNRWVLAGDSDPRRTPRVRRLRPVNPLVELTLARIREFVREPEAVFWVFVFPVLLAIVLGIAFGDTGPQAVRVAVEAPEPGVPESSGSRLMEWLGRRPDIQPVALPSREAARALRSGRVDLVVRSSHPSASAAEETGSGTASIESSVPTPGMGSVVYRYDPTRPESQVARLAVDDALQRAMGRQDVVRVGDETVSQGGARYIDFLIPGLVGLNLMGSGMWGLGFAVVQARARKLLKLLAATPMRRTHFLLSYMLSRLIFLVLEVAAVIGFGWIAFGVSVQGSILDLGLISLVGAMAFAGLGLLVAARTRTIEGVSGLMNLVMLPMWLLSGTFFSSTRFPEFWQPAIQALPLTALNDSLRATINEGLPITSSLPDLLLMVIWGGLSFVLALRWFRWQ